MIFLGQAFMDIYGLIGVTAMGFRLVLSPLSLYIFTTAYVAADYDELESM
jgi:hypothetical protein